MPLQIGRSRVVSPGYMGRSADPELWPLVMADRQIPSYGMVMAPICLGVQVLKKASNEKRKGRRTRAEEKERQGREKERTRESEKRRKEQVGRESEEQKGREKKKKHHLAENKERKEDRRRERGWTTTTMTMATTSPNKRQHRDSKAKSEEHEIPKVKRKIQKKNLQKREKNPKN